METNDRDRTYVSTLHILCQNGRRNLNCNRGNGHIDRGLHRHQISGKPGLIMVSIGAAVGDIELDISSIGAKVEVNYLMCSILAGIRDRSHSSACKSCAHQTKTVCLISWALLRTHIHISIEAGFHLSPGDRNAQRHCLAICRFFLLRAHEHV